MWKYILKRILIAILTLFLIVSIVNIMGSIAVFSRMREFDGFFDYIGIVFKNYYQYMTNVILHGDWGTAGDLTLRWYLFEELIFNTLKLNVISLVIYVFGGTLLGILSAMYKDSWIDYLSGMLALVFASLPTFIVIYILIYTLGYGLDLLPVQYKWAEETVQGGILAYVIPILTIILIPISRIFRMVRGELIETYNSDFTLLLRAKGLKRSQIVTRHMLKNGMIVTLPTIGEMFFMSLGMSFAVEIIYGFPGLARVLYWSLSSGYMGSGSVRINISLLTLVVAVYSAIGISVSLVIDLIHPIFDPRIVMGKAKS